MFILTYAIDRDGVIRFHLLVQCILNGIPLSANL
jgi:hypothetical protein